MPIAVIEQITAWSFSRWKDYEKCPFYAKTKHIDKRKEPGSPAMQRGGEIDKKCEQYLKLPLFKLPEEVKSFAKEFAVLKKLKPMTQENWAFNLAWEKVDWFAKDAWLRVKMDAAVKKAKRARLIDFKTGKPKDDHALQLELYALSGFLLFPEVTDIDTELWYTDLGKEDKKPFKRSQVPLLKETWLDRIKAMLTDKRFSPKPGNYCTWCPFSKAKGGPCKY